MSEKPVITQPQPGFYKCKLVRGGVWCAGRIWIEPALSPEGEPMDRPPMMLAEINGKPVELHAAWVKLLGEPITEKEYRYIRGVKGWADQHAPSAPEADPKKAVDFNTLKFNFGDERK